MRDGQYPFGNRNHTHECKYMSKTIIVHGIGQSADDGKVIVSFTQKQNYTLNTLMGCVLEAAAMTIREGHYTNVYALSDFLPSSFILDRLFSYQIVQNQLLYRNRYFKCRIF